MHTDLSKRKKNSEIGKEIKEVDIFVKKFFYTCEILQSDCFLSSRLLTFCLINEVEDNNFQKLE